jgi:hypothetical protein
MFQAFGFTVSSTCTQTVRKMKQASFMGWELLLCLPLDVTYGKKNLEKDLIYFETIVTNRFTAFSAAGLFDVDLKVVFSILSSVSSILILVMQLFPS